MSNETFFDETRKSVYARNILWSSLTRKPMPKGVVMFHAGRSGSTVLGNLFNQHPDLFWDSETLQAERLNPLPKPLSRRIMRQAKFHLQFRRRRCVAMYYGFEAKPVQISELRMSTADFVTLLRSLEYEHFIVLERRNLLRIIVSHLVAREKGYFHQKTTSPEGQKERSAKLFVNTQAVAFHGKPGPLVMKLDTLEREFDELKGLLAAPGYLHLIYEDDIESDPTAAYGKVCQHLDLPQRPVNIGYQRTNPTPLSGIIENVDDVARALEGSKYSWMLSG